jgi:putative transposase
VPQPPKARGQLLRELSERARAGGLKLTGEGGLLGKLTKMVIEGALEGELDDHFGYGKQDPAGRDGGNSRNGHRAKTVITEAGPVEISVPRDRDSSFEPKIVAERKELLDKQRIIDLAPGPVVRHGRPCPAEQAFLSGRRADGVRHVWSASARTVAFGAGGPPGAATPAGHTRPLSFIWAPGNGTVSPRTARPGGGEERWPGWR